MSPFTQNLPPGALPPRRWCRWHLDFTPDATAVLVGLIPDGPDGQPITVHACRDCQRAHRLEPYTAGAPMGAVRFSDGSCAPLRGDA
jgi:hypothetical protein